MSESERNEAGGGTAAPGQNPPLPKVDFSTFVLSLASSALVYLGDVPNPETGKNESDLDVARHNIDMLEMLQDKIRNGLSPEETRLLEGVLYELRLKYVIKSR
jgi:hypothetical protein